MRFFVCLAAAMSVFVVSASRVLAAEKNNAANVLRDEAPIVTGTQYTIRSDVLDQDRHLTIYLPSSYDVSDKKYPVLYLVDGGKAQDFHPVTGLASLAGLTGMMCEFIVVSVETVKRRYELTSLSSATVK